jgi:hypothetical protein
MIQNLKKDEKKYCQNTASGSIKGTLNYWQAEAVLT